MYKNNTALLK